MYAAVSYSPLPGSRPIEAGRELLARLQEHRQGIYRFLRRKGFGADEADDLTQETLLRALAHAERFRGANLSAWLYRIAANLAVDSIRKRRYELVELEDLVLPAGDGSDPTIRVARDDRHAQLYSLLEQLPEGQRRLLWLRYFEERSLEEIARATDCTPGIAKQRVFRALSALRRRWRLAEVIAEQALA